MPRPNPTTHAGDTSFQVFAAFPRDIGLLIFEHCSPFDLVELAATSVSLRRLINDHSYLWSIAFSNVSRGQCPLPPSCPAIEASGNFSQVAYARWIFQGGPCSHCGQLTSSLPSHFLLRLRACSPRCARILKTSRFLYFDIKHEYDNFSFGKWLPRAIFNTTTYVYNLKSLQTARAEAKAAAIFTRAGTLRGHRPPASCIFVLRNETALVEEYGRRERARPLLEKNAKKLEAWSAKYLQEKKDVIALNIQFLQSVWAKENIKPKRFQDVPKVQQILASFNRDLALITRKVWEDNRSLILAEISALGLGGGKVQCRFCERMISRVGMGDHIVDCHKDQDPDLVVANLKGRLHCKQCPTSKRVFTKEGLEHHRLSQHS
ncbi:hypothetical protein MIND_00886900 [Mycena indigotica]|uniref:F-box domain-containing protein n=1 Tax=Mycena indigotica TaxID=2126181 RepID=A0A8H6SH56_9AGAR|nr:uncharacterized protein MIND_00886900 [Mycena indigotica]KAF7299376.1 hypothetical protein MIND_00886900 [Mycena indigotica]